MAKENSFRYTAKAVRCHACKARGHAAKEFEGKAHDPYGLMFAVEEVELE